jgi:hypothetical protein
LRISDYGFGFNREFNPKSNPQSAIHNPQCLGEPSLALLAERDEVGEHLIRAVGAAGQPPPQAQADIHPAALPVRPTSGLVFIPLL